MGKTTNARPRRPRGSIDAEMILQGAFEVAAKEGLDSMSMPLLAKHLNVGVTSIYWYFHNKDDLLQQMHSNAASRLRSKLPIVADFEPDEWRAYMFQSFSALRDEYAGDDVATELMLNRRVVHGTSGTRDSYVRVESDMGYLMAAGFSAQEAWLTYSTLSMYTRHVISMEQIRKRTQFPPEGVEQLTLLDTPNMPVLTELISEGHVSLDFTDQFIDGLNLILDAAELRRSK